MVNSHRAEHSSRQKVADKFFETDQKETRIFETDAKEFLKAKNPTYYGMGLLFINPNLNFFPSYWENKILFQLLRK